MQVTRNVRRINSSPCTRGERSQRQIFKAPLTSKNAIALVTQDWVRELFEEPTRNAADFTKSGYLVTLCLNERGVCVGCFQKKWFNEDESAAAATLYLTVHINALVDHLLEQNVRNEEAKANEKAPVALEG
jgi:hypothetical protein